VKRRPVVSWVVAILVLCGAVGAPASDVPKANDADQLAGDVIALARLLGERHHEPPAQQQVILLAARALHEARKNTPPRNLVSRCSTAVSDEEFKAILKGACGADFTLNGSVRASVAESIAKSLQGGLQILTKKAGAAQQQLSENRYVGVGISAGSSDDHELQVGTVMPGGPIARAGIEEKTVIRKIDGWATREQSIEEAVERLRGPEGTPVTLTIRRPGKDQDETVTLYRGVVPQKMLAIDIQQKSGRRIAVLRPRELGGSLAHEIREFAEKERNLDGVLLDLRGAYGRAHFAALVADQFLDGGEIGAIESGARRIPVKAEPGELLPEVPLAIATDPGTRGSAAWLATLLMERKRAMVFGQKGEHPNLDFETVELPSGEMVTFATKVLVTPGGTRTLVVSEQTQPQMPNTAEVVNAIGIALKEVALPLGPSSPMETLQSRLQQHQAVRQAINRDSFVIAKEYLENLPVKKG
jgi:C-terminal processing protease CtpA/Prc